MTDPPKVVKITPKKQTFNIVILSFIIFFFLVILAFIAGWSLIQKKTRKAPLVINSDGVGDPEFYEEDEVNATYASTGYDFSGLQMPCTQEEIKAGLPNLPESYKVTNCDPLSKRICVDNYVKGGGICLSTLGGSCRSLYDCASGANACVNNICVNTLDLDTINQPCITDYECQVEGQGHVCDPSLRICKYNYFPFEAGCEIDSDCLSNDAYNQNTCIFTKSNGLSIKGVVGTDKFIISDPTQDNLNYYREGSAVSTVLGDSFFVFNFISNLTLDTDGSYFFRTKQNPAEYYASDSDVTIYIGNTGGNQVGICVSKIPRGGKRISIAGVQIPCDDGLIDSDGFCVENNFYSTQGVVCDKKGNIDSLICDDAFLDKFSKTIKLTCLGDVNIQDQFSRNFNYTYPSLVDNSSSTAFRDEVKFLGYCSYQLAEYQSPCDTTVNNCVEPYLCLTSTDQSGNQFSFCGTDLNRQECIRNSECSNGYKCGSGNICISDPGNICFTSGDGSKGCSDQKYIFYFSLEEQKYVQIGDAVPGIHLGEDIQIRFGSEIDATSDLPTFFLIWSRNTVVNINRPPDYATLNGYKDITDDTYVGDTLSITTYTRNGTTYTTNNSTMNLYPGTGVQFNDVLISSDNKVYAVYQTPAVDDRIRRSRVLGLLDDNKFSLPINCGFVDGDRVNYRGDNFDGGKTYYIYRGNPTSKVQDFDIYQYYLSETENGSVVSPDGPYDNNGEIISYSNGYSLQFPSHDSDINNTPLVGQNFQTGDKFRLVSGTLTIEYIDEYSLDSSRDVYLNQTSGIESYTGNDNFDTENSYFYQLSDENNPGTVTFFRGIRMPWQNISGGELNVTLNPDMISHSIALVNTSKLSQYIVKCDSLVNGRRNGINSGFMYNFDEGRDPHFSMEGNQLILTVDLPYVDPSSDEANMRDSFSLVQELEIKSGDNETGNHQLTTGVYLGGTTTTTQFYFTYQNTSSPPQPRGLYFDQNKSVDKNVTPKIFSNPLNQGDIESLNIISTFTNSQDITVNDDPTVLLSSELQKTGYSNPENVSFPPNLKYDTSDLEAQYFEIEIYDISTPKIDINSVNTYGIGQNFLVFRKSEEIDLILKYGWSELVFMKVKGDISLPGGLNVDFTDNFFTGNGQIILISVGILSYDVTIDGEILVVETHVPLNTGDGGPRNDILAQDNNTWRFYPYNIHPLYTKRMILKVDGDDSVETSMYNFFDSSGLYTSTKKSSFFPTSGKIKETSYNKIFTTNASKDENQEITVINVHDGFGYLTDDEGTYESQIMVTPNTDGGGTYTIFLPSLVPSYTIDGQENIGTSTTFTDESKRTEGQIFGYFFPVSDQYLANFTDGNKQTVTLFNGKSYISQTRDYLFLNNDLNLTGIKYLRPLYSGMIWLRQRGLSNEALMYGVNNLYMSGIPKSIPSRPYYNGRTTDVYYSVSSDGKRKGDINLGVDSYPYYPVVDGEIVEDLDQSYEKTVRWPDWILDNKLVVYTKNPIIDKVFLSTEGGNLGGKLEYYVLANIDGNKNFYLFSSSNDRESILENQGIPTTKSVYDGNVSLDGAVFNRQFFLVSNKVS